MRSRHAIIWSLILTFTLQVPVRGAEPSSAVKSEAATQDAPKEKDKDKDPKKQAVVPGGADQIVELEKWAQLAENPDWLLVIAGIAVAFWGSNQLTGDVGNLLTSSLPAAVKLSRLSGLLKLSEEASKQLAAMAEDMQPLGRTAKQASDALRDHLDSMPKAIRNRPNLAGRRIGEIRELLEKGEVRADFESNKTGRSWLAEYDKLVQAHDEGLNRMMERFLKGTEALQKLSDETNKAGKGIFRQEDLAHRPVRYDIKPMEWGPPGSLAIVADGGFIMEAPDASQFHLLMHNPITKCSDLYTKVKVAWDRAVVGAQSNVLLGPLTHLGVVGLGYTLYRLGGWLIRSRTQSTPDQLVEKAKSEAQTEAVRQLFKTGELVNITDQVRDYRVAGKDADVKDVYKVLRETLRAKLPNIAKEIRSKTNPMLRDQADFEGNLWSFMQNDDMANGLIDSALAEAGQLELKTTNPESIYTLLLSGDAASQPQVDRLLMRHYGSTLKYLWPKLTVDGSALPLDAAKIAEAVNETGAPLQEIIKARKKRTGTHVDSAPGKPAGVSLNNPALPTGLTSSPESVKDVPSIPEVTPAAAVIAKPVVRPDAS